MSFPSVRGGFSPDLFWLHSTAQMWPALTSRTFQDEHLNNGCLCAVRISAVRLWAAIAILEGKPTGVVEGGAGYVMCIRVYLDRLGPFHLKLSADELRGLDSEGNPPSFSKTSIGSPANKHPFLVPACWLPEISWCK